MTVGIIVPLGRIIICLDSVAWTDVENACSSAPDSNWSDVEVVCSSIGDVGKPSESDKV
jgi:hypothetical protein